MALDKGGKKASKQQANIYQTTNKGRSEDDKASQYVRPGPSISKGNVCHFPRGWPQVSLSVCGVQNGFHRPCKDRAVHSGDAWGEGQLVPQAKYCFKNAGNSI